MSEALYNSVLHVEYVKSSEIVVQTQDKLEDIHHKNTQLAKSKKDTSWYKPNMIEDITSKLNISKQLDNLQDSIAQASKNIITLITIFIVQSILMPLIFFWFMIISVKWIFRVKVNSDMIALILNKG